MAFKEALSWLKRLKRLAISKVLIELDSLGVVQTFRQKDKDTSYFGEIMLDCQSIVKDLMSYSVYVIRRSVNSVAHTIVREAGSRSNHKVWLNTSSFLIDIIDKDN